MKPWAVISDMWLNPGGLLMRSKETVWQTFLVNLGMVVMSAIGVFFLANYWHQFDEWIFMILAKKPLPNLEFQQWMFAMYYAISYTIIWAIFGLLFTPVLYVYWIVSGGTGHFAETYRGFVYSLVPFYTFGWIPIFNIISILYSLYYLTMVGRINHQYSTAKSIWKAAWPGLFLLLFAGVIMPLLAFFGVFGILLIKTVGGI